MIISTTVYALSTEKEQINISKSSTMKYGAGKCDGGWLNDIIWDKLKLGFKMCRKSSNSYKQNEIPKIKKQL